MFENYSPYYLEKYNLPLIRIETDGVFAKITKLNENKTWASRVIVYLEETESMKDFLIKDATKFGLYLSMFEVYYIIKFLTEKNNA